MVRNIEAFRPDAGNPEGTNLHLWPRRDQVNDFNMRQQGYNTRPPNLPPLPYYFDCSIWPLPDHEYLPRHTLNETASRR